MKKQLYLLGMVFWLLCWNAACYEDNSPTDLLDLPQVYIDIDRSLSGQTWVAYVNEEFELGINLIWNGEDSTAFDYKWTLNNEVISTDRVLHYTFPQTGSFNVAFEVIERSTGMAVGESLAITVSSKYLLGWLILSDKGGRSALDFIHIDTYELYPDIYQTLHPDSPLGSEPYRLVEHFISAYDQVTVMQRGGPGLIELDGRNFEKVITTKEEFVGEKYPYEGFNPVDIHYTNINSGVEMLLTDKGEVYARLNMTSSGIGAFQTAQYPLTPLEYPDGKGMKISYFTFPKTFNHQPMFDCLNNRWLSIYKSTTTDRMLPPWKKKYKEEDHPDFFDFCEGMDPKMKLIYAQTCDEWSSSCYLINILKDTESGKYYFQKSTLTFATASMTVEVSAPQQYEFAPAYAINDESVFWMLRGQNTAFQASPHVFFSVGNKIYFHRWENGRTYLYKDFGAVPNGPAGKIVSMHTNSRTNEFGVAFSDGHFFIMDSSSGMINAIARGDIDPASGEGAAEIQLYHYSGLGEIKHSIFKYGRFSNWSSAEDRYR